VCLFLGLWWTMWFLNLHTAWDLTLLYAWIDYCWSFQILCKHMLHFLNLWNEGIWTQQ
jgi:hypothetical protein